MTKLLSYLNKNIKKKQPFLIINKNFKLIHLISKSILCLNNKSKCYLKNLCLSCHLVNLKIHPDLFEIKENNNIKLKDTKNLIKFLKYKATISKKKIIIINNINIMNQKAYNYILKTLEEPNNNVYFFIIAKNNNIKSTILERCHIINIKQNSKITNKNLTLSEDLTSITYLYKKTYMLIKQNIKSKKISNLIDVITTLNYFYILLYKQENYNSNLIFHIINKKINESLHYKI